MGEIADDAIIEGDRDLVMDDDEDDYEAVPGRDVGAVPTRYVFEGKGKPPGNGTLDKRT